MLTFLSSLSYECLKPNVGLYWYLFVEMFDFFRPLFVCFLQLHSLFYGVPLAVRFKKDPLFMALICIALQSLLQPFPTVADASLYLAMIPMFPEIIQSNIIINVKVYSDHLRATHATRDNHPTLFRLSTSASKLVLLGSPRKRQC